MLVKDVIKKTTDFFNQKGISSPRLDAELLISHALGWNRLDVFLKFDLPLKEQELEKCRESIKRRSTGEPVAYITRTKDFYKSSFYVEPGVLIPRPETEHIVEMGLEFLKTRASGIGLFAPLILDFGCGSGCIGLSLIKENPEARLVGIDISEKAIEISKRNAEELGLSGRALFIQKDVAQVLASDFAGWGEQPCLIVGNPPYIDVSDTNVEENVIKFEPREAIFSAQEGLSHIAQWLLKARELMAENSLYLCEIGSDQREKVTSLAQELQDVKVVNVHRDLAGHDRVLSVQF